jgi:hypothetical protein
MFSRIILASATLVALGAPAAQAGPFHFFLCNFAKSSQCAINFMTGDGNSETIKQTTTSRHGFQFALQVQDGNNNNAYTEQIGKNQVAVSVQTGDNNHAYTYQEGKNQLAVTTQDGNGMWALNVNAADNTVTTVTGSN